MCTDYEDITHKNYERRGRCGFSTLDIQDYTPEPQTTIASRVTELYKVQNSTTYSDSTNRFQESYRQIMNQGKQVQVQLYNKNTRVLPRLEQSQKVVVQLDPSKNIWTPAEIIQCPTPAGRSYSVKTINSGVHTRNRRFIKLDLTAAEEPVPKPISEPNVTRPTRTIWKPDRLIESK